MTPEAAAEAMQAYAEETNRLDRQRRASGAADRRELADIGKKIRTMIAAIEEGGYVRGLSDRLRELGARQDEVNERLAAGRADLPDIHPTSPSSTGASSSASPGQWPIPATATRRPTRSGG